jgi:hypothetical protein
MKQSKNGEQEEGSPPSTVSVALKLLVDLLPLMLFAARRNRWIGGSVPAGVLARGEYSIPAFPFSH